MQRLQERLEQFPEATRWEWEGVKLEVARSLAGNTRAFVQVGEGTDIARAFVASELMAEQSGRGCRAGGEQDSGGMSRGWPGLTVVLRRRFA